MAEYGLATEMPAALVDAYQAFTGRLAERVAIEERKVQAEKRRAEREHDKVDRTEAAKRSKVQQDKQAPEKAKLPEIPKIQYPIEDEELTKADRKDEVGKTTGLRLAPIYNGTCRSLLRSDSEAGGLWVQASERTGGGEALLVDNLRANFTRAHLCPRLAHRELLPSPTRNF